MKTKEQIKEEIRSIERRLSMRRDAAAYWRRIIEISKHSIQTFYPDLYESITIGDYISELEEAKLSYTDACQDIHRLKKERNNLQRKQNSF